MWKIIHFMTMSCWNRIGFLQCAVNANDLSQDWFWRSHTIPSGWNRLLDQALLNTRHSIVQEVSCTNLNRQLNGDRSNFYASFWANVVVDRKNGATKLTNIPHYLWHCVTLKSGHSVHMSMLLCGFDWAAWMFQLHFINKKKLTRKIKSRFHQKSAENKTCESIDHH